MSKLDGINIGDRVRVTFEGEVKDKNNYLTLEVVKGEGDNSLTSKEVDHPSFQIERIEQPLAVNDVVQLKSKPSITYKVVYIDGDSVALWGPTYSSIPTAYGAYVKDLERIP